MILTDFYVSLISLLCYRQLGAHSLCQIEGIHTPLFFLFQSFQRVQGGFAFSCEPVNKFTVSWKVVQNYELRLALQNLRQSNEPWLNYAIYDSVNHACYVISCIFWSHNLEVISCGV